MKRYVKGTILTSFLSVIVWFGFLHFEKCYLLKELVQVLPIPENDQPSWLNKFLAVGKVHLLVTAGLTIVWMSFGQFAFGLLGQFAFLALKKSRGLWWILLFLQVIISLIFAFIVPATQDLGRLWVLFCYLINSLFVYLFASLFQSPSNVMFSPYGARFFYRKIYQVD